MSPHVIAGEIFIHIHRLRLICHPIIRKWEDAFFFGFVYKNTDSSLSYRESLTVKYGIGEASRLIEVDRKIFIMYVEIVVCFLLVCGRFFYVLISFFCTTNHNDHIR